MKVLALDWETGGLFPKTCAPVSLGLAVMDGLTVLDSKEWIFGKIDGMTYEPKAMEIHGITVADLEGKPSQLEVYRDVKEWLSANSARDLPIVSHNALFDQGFWSEWLFRCGKRLDPDDKWSYRPAPELLSGAWHCTKRLASRVLPKLTDHKLDTVAAHYELKRSSGLHGALEDAVLCGQLLALLLPELSPVSVPDEDGAL